MRLPPIWLVYGPDLAVIQIRCVTLTSVENAITFIGEEVLNS